MAKLKNEKEYRAALKRIDELLPITGDGTPADDPNMLELDIISSLVEEYELVHYPIGKPSLLETIKLRMYEMGLTKQGIAELLGISDLSLNEIFLGKKEPSLSLARTISQKLNIEPSIVLGV
jgi:HTH-type transcriptional regulator/antitoxin HigA